jgi:hypothetical protein
MNEVAAARVRRDAVQRLVDLAAGDREDEQYDIDLLLARPASLEILRRRVWDRRRDDLQALHELERIWPLCQGRKEALIDVVHAGGLDPDAPPIPTVEDVAAALAAWSS